MLHDLKFTLSPAEEYRPVDERTDCLCIDPLRQLAACFGTPTPDQNKDKFQLGKYVMKELHAGGVIVQTGLEFFFESALTAQHHVRAAGSTEDLAAAAELIQAAMLQQIEDVQLHLAAVRATGGAPRNFGVMPYSDLSATPAALGDSEAEELIADGSAVLLYGRGSRIKPCPSPSSRVTCRKYRQR